MPFFSSLLYLIVVLLLAHFRVLDLSLSRYGLPGWFVVGILLLMLLGGLVDVFVINFDKNKEQHNKFFSRFLFNTQGKAKKGVYLNLGGLIAPVFFSIYLFFYTPLIPTLIALLVVIILAKLFSKFFEIKSNWKYPLAFTPLLASLSLSLLLSPANPAAVFYVAGILGTIMGAGLLNIDKIKKAPLFIGGREMFKQLFIAGIIFLFL